MVATGNGHLDIVLYMSSKVENPNSPWNGMSPLHMAAHRGHIDIFKFLYCHSKVEITSLNAPDPTNGLTAIHWAAYEGHIEIIKFLADKVGINQPVSQNTGFIGYTPLHIAAFKGHLDIVKFLAVRMHDPNVQIPWQINSDGWTPIELAAQGLHSEIVSYITGLQEILSQWSNKSSEGNEINVRHGNPWNLNFSNYYPTYSCLVLSCAHVFYWTSLISAKHLKSPIILYDETRNGLAICIGEILGFFALRTFII